MSTMWKGGKKDQQNGGQLSVEPPHPIQDDGASRSSRRSHEPSRRSAEEPTERTRLLVNHRPPPSAEGYLDPDDPAVGHSTSILIRVKLTRLGLSLQPLVRAGHALPHYPLPHYILPLVGTIAGFHLCLAAWTVHPWLRLLRLCIHMPHHWKSTCGDHLLRHSRQRNSHHHGHHRSVTSS